jgi:hypothetical protein
VCVQALHPHPCAANAPSGRDKVLTYRGVATALRVLIVCATELVLVDELLESMHATITLETTHARVKLRIHQPEQRRHRRAVAQMGLVLDDDGPTVRSANNDGEPARGWTPKQRFDDRLIVE